MISDQEEGTTIRDKKINKARKIKREDKVISDKVKREQL